MIEQLLTPGAAVAASLGFVLGVIYDQVRARTERNQR